MSIAAAVDEITIRTRENPSRQSEARLRATLDRLDDLAAELEELNLRDLTRVPADLRLQIAVTVDGLLGPEVSVPATPTDALGAVFDAQAQVLRQLFPEYHDRADDEFE